MYRETTRDVVVEVLPKFIPEHSSPEICQYIFSYQVKITNLSDAPTRLVARHWIITDGKGKIHEVKGDGVIGEQPLIQPGQTFEYSSFCPLPTPTGNMRGKYFMSDKNGERFDVRIPLFFLRDHRKLH